MAKITTTNNTPRTMWQNPPPFLMAIAGVFVIWLWVFDEALHSAASVWWVSDTFNHCFFVIPGAFYLAWRERAQLAQCSPQFNAWVLLPLIVVLALGLLGKAAELQLFSHVAAFASLSLLFWALLGNHVARVLWFPLLFVGFAVPFGDELIPFFQKITADMAVTLLDWVGIAVYRTGLYIEIPTGRFVVAEACSGVRFFIACVAFGALYAYVSYRHTGRRLAFFTIAIVFPVLANGLRVFGIIIIAHFSNMKYATGADHLVYGWVFFSFVMLVLILIGERLRTADDCAPVVNDKPLDFSHWHAKPWLRTILWLILPLVFFKAWLYAMASQPPAANRDINDALLAGMGLSTRTASAFVPHYQGWSDEYTTTIIEGGASTLVYMAWYNSNQAEAELIASANRLYDVEQWSLMATKQVTMTIDGKQFDSQWLNITNATGYQRWLVYWYQLPNGEAVNAVNVKLTQAIDKLLGGSGAGAVVVFSAPYNSADQQQVEQQIRNLIEKTAPVLKQALPFN